MKNEKEIIEEIVTYNGELIYEDHGQIEDEQGYMQPTYNLKVEVYEIQTEYDVLYFIRTKDNGSLNEFEPLEVEDVKKIGEAVKSYLKNWDDIEWIESFERENIL